MRKLFVALSLILLTSFGCKAQNSEIEQVINKDHRIDTNAVLHPQASQSLENQRIMNYLEKLHYGKVVINDSLSSVIFDNFIKTLDQQRLYFFKSDIDRFEVYRHKFGEYMKEGVLDPAFDIFNVYKQRVTEVTKYITAALKQELDLTKDEKMKLDRKNDKYAATPAERDELWRKWMKYEVLSAMFINKTKTQQECREQVTRREQNFHKLMLQYTSEDIFSLYINSIVFALDPHTYYLSPSASEQFKINMNLSLEGIGATLTNDGDYVTISNVVPGSPAFKSKAVEAGDKIMAVAQGDTGRYVDIVQWRTDDAVHLIRGKQGTIVRLRIIKAKAGINDLPVEVRIVRDKVIIEEQRAKKDIIEVDQNGKRYKIGIIDLQTFYNDTAKDVRKLLEECKAENVDGIIVDLRGNGGGSLPQVVEMAGLFIRVGPIVQVRYYDNSVEVDRDPDAGIVYDGPLAVMTDVRSASASEIFAAAMQDYGRGIIIGERTYGKGTVQQGLALDPKNSSSEKLGQINLTIAKFYRINGSSTQRKGVSPDIVFPSILAQKEYGEESQPSALPWDKINTSYYEQYADLSKYIPILKEKHEKRIKTIPDFKYLLEDIADYNKQKSEKEISLSEKVRRKEMEDYDKKKKEREQLKLKAVKEVNLPEKEQKDFELREGGNILADLIDLTKSAKGK